MLNICFIGSNGFLSKSLGRFLNSQNVNLTVIGRQPPQNYKFSNFIEVDLLKSPVPIGILLKQDIIFYLTATGVQSNETNASTNDTYLLNTFRIVDVLNQLQTSLFSGSFFSFGSYFEIGANSLKHRFTELEILCAKGNVPNHYCISKRLLSCFISSSKYKFNQFHLILPTIYGENEASHRLIPYILSQIKQDKPIHLTSGSQVREYLYIEDLCSIIWAIIMQNVKPDIYNILGSEVLSVKDLVHNILSFLGADTQNVFFGEAQRQDTTMQYLSLDGSKLSHVLKDNEIPNKKTIISIINNY